MRRDVAICWRARGVIAPQRSERKWEFPATAEVPDKARASGTAADRNLRTKCSYEPPTRGTVGGTPRSMCGADAGCWQ